MNKLKLFIVRLYWAIFCPEELLDIWDVSTRVFSNDYHTQICVFVTYKGDEERVLNIILETGWYDDVQLAVAYAHQIQGELEDALYLDGVRLWA
jgi:hypothetical protein